MNRARAITARVTDYNVGSVSRVLLEAPAQETDRLYQELLKELLGGIATSVYTSFNFPALPAQFASGPIRVSIAVQGNAILIPAGSTLTRSDGSAVYTTIVDVTLPVGVSFADVKVVAELAGIAGNMPALGSFVLDPPISGFVSATNLGPFSNGAAAETPHAQKVRFDAYITNLARGTGASIENALLRLAVIEDTSGNVTERVASVSIVEPYLSNPALTIGLVQAYVHNGVGKTSSALVSEAQAVTNGYIDPTGTIVSGYKAAGVQITVFAATEIPLAVVGMLTVSPTFDPAVAVAQVTAALYIYVLGIGVGEPYIGAVADDLVMQVPGVLNWVPLGTLAYVGVPLSGKLMPANFQIVGWLSAATVIKTATTGDLPVKSIITDLGIVNPISFDSAIAALTAVDHGAILVGTAQSSDAAIMLTDTRGVGFSSDSTTATLSTAVRLVSDIVVSSDTASASSLSGVASGALFITPGSGLSFTDPAGNIYTLPASEAATENGSPMAGGGGTAKMALYQGTVYGQDNNSGLWYTWNQTSFIGPVTAPPSGGSTPPTGTPTLVASNLDVPWAIGFLPDGSFLVTQRNSFNIRRCSAAGATLGTFAVPNTVTTGGEGGLMGLAIDPGFGNINNFIYICHTRTYNGGYTGNGNEVIRYTLSTASNTISAGIRMLNYGSGQFHNGGSLGIGPDGCLYVTTGNGTNPNGTSQVLTGIGINDGKILRINLDFTAPTDNPFNTDGTKAVAGDGKIRSLVWTWGHRNPQGICWSSDGSCWSTENGPTGESFGNFSGITGNDKINLIVKGKNYGFPLTYGAGTATDAFGITTTPPVFTSGNNEVWAPEGIVAFNNSIFFAALGGLGSPPGTASLNQFTLTQSTQTRTSTLTPPPAITLPEFPLTAQGHPASGTVVYFAATFTVPAIPVTMSDQQIDLWIGLQPATAVPSVFQPVLSWSQSAGWQIQTVWVTGPLGGTGTEVSVSGLTSVTPGTVLTAIIQCTGSSGGTFNYQGSFQGYPNSVLNVTGIPPQNVPFIVFEQARNDICAKLISGPVVFSNITVNIGTPGSAGAPTTQNWTFSTPTTPVCGGLTAAINSSSQITFNFATPASQIVPPPPTQTTVTVFGPPVTSGITKRLTDGHRKRAAALVPGANSIPSSSTTMQLSNSIFTAGIASGIKVGTFSVTGDTGWTFTVPVGNFRIASDGVSLISAATLTQSSYAVVVTGAKGIQTAQQTFTVTASPAASYGAFPLIANISNNLTGQTLVYFAVTFTVPPPPAWNLGGQSIILWPGLEPADASYVLQPIIALNSNNQWNISSVYVFNHNSSEQQSGVVTVQPGTVLTGIIKCTGTSGGLYNYEVSWQGYPTTVLAVTGISQATVPVIALEQGSVQNCAMFPPGNVVFSNITVNTGTPGTTGTPITPAWSGTPGTNTCGLSLTVNSPSQITFGLV